MLRAALFSAAPQEEGEEGQAAPAALLRLLRSRPVEGRVLCSRCLDTNLASPAPSVEQVVAAAADIARLLAATTTAQSMAGNGNKRRRGGGAAGPAAAAAAAAAAEPPGAWLGLVLGLTGLVEALLGCSALEEGQRRKALDKALGGSKG